MKPHLTITQDSVQIQLTVEGDWEQALAALLANYSVATVCLVRQGYAPYDGYSRVQDRPIIAVKIELREPVKAHDAAGDGKESK